MSSNECPGKLKCLAIKVFASFLIEERWPDSHSLIFRFVSPTCWWSNLQLLIRYTTLVVEQERSESLITVHRRLANKKLRKNRDGWITARVAKCGLLHLLTDILERTGAFRSTERPVDVPPKCRPGALLTRATSQPVWNCLDSCYAFRTKAARYVNSNDHVRARTRLN